MPLDATATRAAMADRGRNPKLNSAKGSVASSGGTMSLELTFQGVSVGAEQVYDALDAAFGTITSDGDSPAGNRFRLRVAP